MKDLMVVTSAGNETGFQIAGYKTGISNKKEVSSYISDLINQYNLGIVCIEDSLYDHVRPEVIKRAQKKGIPVLMSIPVPHMWDIDENRESPLARLIRRTIGYQVKLKK